MKRRLLPCIGAIMLLGSGDALAGGLQVSDRGVRPLGRGGAFVAGADDLGAIWYNPAGIAEAGTSMFADVNFVFFSGDFQRQTMVTDQDGNQFVRNFESVHGKNKFLPLPTGALSYNFGRQKQYTVAIGAMAPQAMATSWPENGPQRYTLIDQSGSIVTFLGAWFGWKAKEWLQIGGGPMVFTGFYNARITFNANPRDRLLGAPEDPSYDARGQNNAGLIFAPGANLGVIVKPEKHVRIGISGQTPFQIHAPASLKLQLPGAAPFDDASVRGDDATLRFRLPWAFRAGVEVRPIADLKVEVAWVHDFWGSSSDLVVQPESVNLYGIKGFPSPYAVSPIKIPLGFNDTNSFRFGAEYRIHQPLRRWIEGVDLDIEPRAGFMWDPAAAQNAYLSVLAFDLDRCHLSFGGSIHIGEHIRLDALYMHSFLFSQDVDPRVAAVPGINPVAGNPTSLQAVNGGHYSASMNTFGMGGNYRF